MERDGAEGGGVNFKTWRYVLVSIEPGPNTPPKGYEVVGSGAYFSRETCAEDARLIAQSLFVTTGTKYGFRCVNVDFAPPDLDAQI